MSVFCLVEADDGAIVEASLRALTLARGLAAGGGLAAVVFSDVPAADLAEYGVTEVHVAAGIEGYAPLAWARALAGLLDGAGAVVAAGTDRGNEVLAHLGAITGLPMAANCVAASRAAEGAVEIVRQRWAGLLLEEAVLDAPVALLTTATDAFGAEPAEVPGAPVVQAVAPSLASGDLVVRAADDDACGSQRRPARAEDRFGGAVGVSRVVTSEGWRPHTQQVGQTGTKITPVLYLACGISGAIQHIAGCSGAKHIIANNTDPAAPILGRADYAIIGDLHEIIPALVKALRART